MKTTKLSKNFAALCLSVAAFCAAQSGFAEVVVPEWQNSFTVAPAKTDQFYMYHIASEKFATNQNAFVEDTKATPWQQNSTLATLVDGTPIYLRIEAGVKAFGAVITQPKYNFNEVASSSLTNTARTFTFDYKNNAWSLSCKPASGEHQLQGNDGQFKVSMDSKTYEWYLISPAQYNNHISIADAKVVLDEANGLLESAVESESKQTLQSVVDNTEASINAVNIETDASVSINEKVEVLKSAISDFKVANISQMVQVLGNAITNAQEFSPMFDFLTDAINAANEVYQKGLEASAEELDGAKNTLLDVVAQAQAIVDAPNYAYFKMIEESNAKAVEAGYTGHNADDATESLAAAKVELVKITSVDGLKALVEEKWAGKEKSLQELAVKAAGDVARYVYAEDVVAQAAKIGYTADVAPLKAAAVDELPALIEGIRTNAITGIDNYVDTYEGEDPIDMTIFIKNNSFELGDLTGWNVTDEKNDTGVKLAATQNPVTTNVDGGFLFNSWDGERGYGISQKLENLPNGKYKLEALLTSAPKNTTFLTIDRTAVGEGVSSVNAETEFVNASYELNVTNKTVTIGALGGQDGGFLGIGTYNTWYRADNFRLSLISLKTVELADDAETYAYEEGSIRRVKVTRTIQPGQWTTLCLPMNCAIPQYVTLYEVNEDKETKVDEHVSIVVEASKDKTILAGKPYIVNYPATHQVWQVYHYVDVPNPTITEFVAIGVELAEEPKAVGTYVPFTGLFSATDLNAGDIYVSTAADYGSGEAPVYKELSADASNKQMKGFRAYFKVTDGASSNVRFITDEVITSIMQAIEDQQVANGTYDLSGRKAATLQKGTYVIDGKKVIIK